MLFEKQLKGDTHSLPTQISLPFLPSLPTHSTICCSFSSQAALSALKQLSEQGLDPVDGPIKVQKDLNDAHMAAGFINQLQPVMVGLDQLRVHPRTHVHHFRSTFFFHRKAAVGVCIYMHYVPVSAEYFA